MVVCELCGDPISNETGGICRECSKVLRKITREANIAMLKLKGRTKGLDNIAKVFEKTAGSKPSQEK